jgi:capsular exopolysaccharide synthesis family protein
MTKKVRKTKKGNGFSIAHARESFGKIKVNIEFLSVDNSYKCILFSSAMAGEGKSTVAANLAISFAASDRKTLLVDADLRHPTQHRLFDVVNKVGLSDIIANNLHWKDYVVETGTPNLFIISAGRTPPNPSELLGSNRMGELIREFKKEYDFILMDSSPLLLVPDPVSLSKHVDGIVLIARHNFTSQQAILDSKDALKIAKRPLIGAILNNVSANDRLNYGYGKRYGYMHGYYHNSDAAKEQELSGIR